MGGVRLYVMVVLAVLLCGLAAMIPLAWTGAGVLTDSYREAAVRDMTANANLFALAASKMPEAERRSPDALGELVKTASAGSRSRFTVALPDGSVLADSEEEPERMENHANRPEIKQALSGKTGVDIRQSSTLGTEWIYAAIPFPGGGAIRAAADMRSVNERLALWWKKAVVAFCAAFVVLAVLAVFAARTLSRPLEAAAEGATRYARGEFGYRLPVEGSREMRNLSSSLGTMAEELDARFKLIRRQQEEMRAVFENMSEGVLAVDGDGRVMLLNRQAGKMLELSGDVTGKTLESVSRNAELLDAVHDATASTEFIVREVRVAGAAGAETVLEAHAARMRGDAETAKRAMDAAGVLAVLRDVTLLKRLETMRRDFVANVSHELRTPVTAIQSALETLQDEDGISGESREFLDVALRNTRRMGSIIGNLLILAGMESGNDRIAGEVEPNDVRPVIDEALSLCREAADERKVTFNVDCEQGLSAKMNPSLIVHALVNLVDNAIKYGAEGGAIGVAARANGETVQIIVSDTGPGIAPKHQDRVFERFYRVGGSGSVRIKKGSGLGLALAKHIVLSQGGDITLESEIGAGSVFRIILPAG